MWSVWVQMGQKWWYIMDPKALHVSQLKKAFSRYIIAAFLSWEKWHSATTSKGSRRKMCGIYGMPSQAHQGEQGKLKYLHYKSKFTEQFLRVKAVWTDIKTSLEWENTHKSNTIRNRILYLTCTEIIQTTYLGFTFLFALYFNCPTLKEIIGSCNHILSIYALSQSAEQSLF